MRSHRAISIRASLAGKLGLHLADFPIVIKIFDDLDNDDESLLDTDINTTTSFLRWAGLVRVALRGEHIEDAAVRFGAELRVHHFGCESNLSPSDHAWVATVV